MGRTLRQIGLSLLAATAGVLLGESLRWFAAGAMDTWVARSFWGGSGCLAAGVLLSFLSPAGRGMTGPRCARCGVRTERGHTLCRDHLRAAVNVYQDEMRKKLVPGRGRVA